MRVKPVLRMAGALLLGFAGAGSSPGLAAPDYTRDFAAPILAAHNRERATVGVPALVWSADLAARAQAWAAHLAKAKRFEHAPARDRPDQGENLFSASSGDYSPQEMIADLAEEKSDFRPGRYPAVTKDGAIENVEHYTQIIWRKSRAVGCGMASGGGEDVLVCRYSPPGNQDGVRVP